MKLVFDRSYNTKTNFYKYCIIGNDEYTAFAREISSYYRPLFILKNDQNDLGILEEENFLRSWLGILSFFIPYFKPKYTLKLEGIDEKYYMTNNNSIYSIQVNENFYQIKGHSHCNVTIWENGQQVGLLRRLNVKIGKGFESIEVLYEKRIPFTLIILFSVFGWERFVGRMNGNQTITTISLIKDNFNVSWTPNE